MKKHKIYHIQYHILTGAEIEKIIDFLYTL